MHWSIFLPVHHAAALTFSVDWGLTVGVWFYGTVVGGQAEASDDLGRVGWFAPSDPPEPLAFPTDRLVLANIAMSLHTSSDWI